MQSVDSVEGEAGMKNLFEVLDKMNTEHEGSLHAYFSNNIENLNAGRDGWGSLKMAITTGDAQELVESYIHHDDGEEA